MCTTVLCAEPMLACGADLGWSVWVVGPEITASEHPLPLHLVLGELWRGTGNLCWMLQWTDGQTDKVYNTSNGNWDSGQKGLKAAGKCVCRAVKPWRTLLQAPSLLKQMWSLLMASRNSLFWQDGQGITKRHCLEVRVPPHTGGCSGIFLRAHACPSVSSLVEEVSPSGAASLFFQITSKASWLLWECILPHLRKILSGFGRSNAHHHGTPHLTEKHIRIQLDVYQKLKIIQEKAA